MRLSRAVLGEALELLEALRPLRAPACRFEPSCSDYARQALATRDWGAYPLILKRLLRCHPWHAGGLDPVPGP